MAERIPGLWLPPTIEEDEEVAVDESDSEEETVFKGKSAENQGAEPIFSNEFSFPVESGEGGVVEGGWEVGEEVMGWAEKRRDKVMTSLDSKILRAIERRRLKVQLAQFHFHMNLPPFNRVNRD